jgi:hypothetical protein
MAIKTTINTTTSRNRKATIPTKTTVEEVTTLTRITVERTITLIKTIKGGIITLDPISRRLTTRKIRTVDILKTTKGTVAIILKTATELHRVVDINLLRAGS